MFRKTIVIAICAACLAAVSSGCKPKVANQDNAQSTEEAPKAPSDGAKWEITQHHYHYYHTRDRYRATDFAPGNGYVELIEAKSGKRIYLYGSITVKGL